jgi:arginyl-tRNA synthetase
MILPLHDRLRDRVRAVIADRYALGGEAGVTIAIESPPNRALGDLGTPVAFDLARRLRQAPRQIAQEIATAFGALEGVARVEAAPNGYLNVFLDREAFLLSRLGVVPLLHAPRAAGGKAIVEHTAINPNKAAHIGHVRNSCLGDTLGRVLRFRGTPVEIQNYIDDTGVQVADVVVGLRHLEGLDLDGVRRTADSTRFDYYCWDLYARVTEWYDGDKARLQVRAETLHDIEHSADPTAAIASLVADRIVRCHLKTMGRLNIDYDLLTWEGDILRLQFWARAFEVLKQTGAVFLQTEGRLEGCWVMRIDDDPDAPQTDTDPGEPAAGEDEAREKVIVRSNGTVTYVGKDMAYQLWKSGLLGQDFHYRRFATTLDGRILWATTSDVREAAPITRRSARRRPPTTSSTCARRTCRSCSNRRSSLSGTRPKPSGSPTSRTRWWRCHTPRRASSATRPRPIPTRPESPSSRSRAARGSGSRPTTCSTASSRRRKPKSRAATRRCRTRSAATAQTIGVAAVRYFMIKYSRTKVIAFDIDEALSFEGESGPYLQYAVVRANNIFQKLQERERDDRSRHPPLAARHAGGRADRRRRRSRSLGARPRSLAARRRGRAGRPDARILRAGEVRIRPGADVQRAVPQVAHPERGAPGSSAMARGRGGLLPPAARACP